MCLAHVLPAQLAVAVHRYEDTPLAARTSLLKYALDSRVNNILQSFDNMYNAPANCYYNFGGNWAEILAERCEQEGVDGDIGSTVNL